MNEKRSGFDSLIPYLVGAFEEFYEQNKPETNDKNYRPSKPGQKVYDEQGNYLIQNGNQVTTSKGAVPGNPINTFWIELDPPVEGFVSRLHTHPNAGSIIKKVENGSIVNITCHGNTEGLSTSDYASASSQAYWQVVVDPTYVILFKYTSSDNKTNVKYIILNRNGKF